MAKYFTPPGGDKPRKVGGARLAAHLKEKGWTQVPPPEPAKRSRAKGKTYYVNGQGTGEY